MIGTKLLTYDIKVSNYVSGKVSKFKYKDKTTINVVVTNLLSCIDRNLVLVYSRNTSKSTVSKRGITTRKVINAVDFLEKEGYIVNHIGRSHSDPEQRAVSYVTPTEKFFFDFVQEAVVRQAKKAYDEAYVVVEVRDGDKQPIHVRQTKEVKKMSDLIKALNKMNESCEIKSKDGKLLNNYYCRVFNEDLSRGGRFYKADVLTIKNKEKDEYGRLDITINVEPVTEVDYSNLHFRILAVKKGIDLFSVQNDVYDRVLADSSNDVDRTLVKVAINIMFNCDSKVSAERALRSHINKMSKKDKEESSNLSAKEIMECVFDAYPDFHDVLCTSKDIGLTLQNDDSNIAALVLEKLVVEKGIVCLPVHDSFVVQSKHENILIETMADCFREYFNVDTLVPMRIEWKEEDARLTYQIME